MRHPLTLLITIFLLIGCRDKVICPAFQSTYILDDSVRTTYYSYLWKIDKEERMKYLAGKKPTPDDTLNIDNPTDGVDYYAYVESYVVPPNEVEKTKFGIIKYEPYWLKNYRLKSAPMEDILAPYQAPKDTVVDVGEFVASDFTDSVVVDSTAVVVEEDSIKLPVLASAQVKPKRPETELQYLYRYDPKDKQLNVEQAYYNKHFGEYLTRRVPIQYPDETANDSTATREKGSFFKNLFGGKKAKSDSLSNDQSNAIFEEDSVDEIPETIDESNENVDEGN